MTSSWTSFDRRPRASRSISPSGWLAQLKDGGVRLINNPKRSAGFRVLRAPDVPSVLVEMGYLSNEQEEKLLTSPDWQKKVASILARSIEGVFPGIARSWTNAARIDASVPRGAIATANTHWRLATSGRLIYEEVQTPGHIAHSRVRDRATRRVLFGRIQNAGDRSR